MWSRSLTARPRKCCNLCVRFERGLPRRYAARYAKAVLTKPKSIRRVHVSNHGCGNVICPMHPNPSHWVRHSVSLSVSPLGKRCVGAITLHVLRIDSKGGCDCGCLSRNSVHIDWKEELKCSPFCHFSILHRQESLSHIVININKWLLRAESSRQGNCLPYPAWWTLVNAKFGKTHRSGSERRLVSTA